MTGIIPRSEWRRLIGPVAALTLALVAAQATLLAAGDALARPVPKLIGIIAVDKAPTVGTNIGADTWQEAVEQSALVRSLGLSVAMLRTLQAQTEALTARSGEFFAIINPNGETFLCDGPEGGKPMLDRIRSYVGQGGIWWETGGWPLCHPFWAKPGGGWEVGNLGGESGSSFRLEAQNWKDDAPAVTPTVTDAGREWLGASLADALSHEMIAAQRASTADSASVVLARTGELPYLTGHRAGYGWLLKCGGFNPARTLIVPSVLEVCKHLWTLSAEVANPAPGSAAMRPHPPSRIGIICPQPNNGAPLAISPDDLRDALSETGLTRCAYLAVVPLTTPEALDQALTERAASYLAIINPMGESFLAGEENGAKPMLARIRSYLEQGGIWWEVGGIPFWYPCWPKREGGKLIEWGHGNFGPDGLAAFGGKCQVLADVDPPPVQVTTTGREMLGSAWTDLVAQQRGDANRPPDRQPGMIVLAEVAGKPYVAATHVGKGLLWQIGGMPVSPAVVFPAIMGTCRYLWTHPVPGM